MESLKRATAVLSRYSDKMVKLFTVLSISFFFCSIFSGVLLRFIFRRPNSALEDLSRTGFIWACFMGAVVAYRRASFIRFEFLVNRLPYVARHALQLLNEVLMLALVVFLVVYGYRLTVQVWPTWQLGAKISKGYMYMALPVSMVFMGVQSLDFIAGELYAFTAKGRAGEMTDIEPARQVVVESAGDEEETT